jgi:hypothetical protein
VSASCYTGAYEAARAGFSAFMDPSSPRPAEPRAPKAFPEKEFSSEGRSLSGADDLSPKTKSAAAPLGGGPRSPITGSQNKRRTSSPPSRKPAPARARSGTADPVAGSSSAISGSGAGGGEAGGS